MRPGWPLLSLAIAAFAIGTTEFAPMGLLPNIADGFGVDIPTAGYLVSAYAIGVMVFAPVMTLALARLRKRSALVILMGILVIGNLLSAIAPTYGGIVAARIVTSMCHGAFFGLGALVAASLAAPGRQAGALATMFMGLSIANIGGVPAATWVGQQIGWRPAFAVIAALGIISAVTLMIALPKGERGAIPDMRQELAVLARGKVLLTLATTVLGAGAMFTVYTYITPLLAQMTSASPTFVTVVLVLVGVGFTLGNVLGGKLADRSLDGSVMTFLVLLALISLALPYLATTYPGAALGFLIWGVATFATLPPLQMRAMVAASEAPALASSINIGAFNLGNALGAFAGGAVLSAGLGYSAIPIACAALAVMTLVLAAASRQWSVLELRSRPAAVHGEAPAAVD